MALAPFHGLNAECVDKGRSPAMMFEEHGSASGTLMLSLAIPQARIVYGVAPLVGLRLSVVSDVHVDVFRDVPLGTYDVEVDDAATGKQLPYRNGYLVQITQIAIDHVSPQCPAYQTLNLNEEYDLQPGRYTVRVTRKIDQLVSWHPYKTQPLPTVVSNDASLEVLHN